MNKRTKQKNNDTKYDAKEEEKKIDKWDIIKTIAGGYIAVLLEYFA